MKTVALRKTESLACGLLWLALLSAKGATATHDLAADFNLDSNPTASGWGYNVAVAAGGGPVGARTDNWNQPDFGPDQPGWEGPQGAAHAGWARRIDNAIPNGSPADDYDAPVGTVLTHGSTSVLWKAPANDTNHYATISGGMWNIRHFGRGGPWRIYKNNVILTQGNIGDDSGSSTAPMSLDTGSGGPFALKDLPYVAGDLFRLEVLAGDFVAVNFKITTSNVGPDPDIGTQPTGALLTEGAAVGVTLRAE
jgi:hypothetical protein